MTSRRLLSVSIVVCLAIAGPAMAQLGHPAKGSWLGYWGQGKDDQHRMRLLMHWEDQTLSGVINPGPKAVPVDKATIDYDDWTMTLEAKMPDSAGKAVPWVATGKIENLGSWYNRRWSGTYRYGDETGDFSLTLQ